MNIIKLHHAITCRLVGLLRRMYFYLFQKPIYLISYNCGGNKFVCHGILNNSSMFLTRG